MKQSYYLTDITDRVRPLVIVSQYDTNRTIQFNLNDTPTSAKVIIGTEEIVPTINGSAVSFLVPTSLTDTAQKLKGEVIIGDRMGTVNFDFWVDATPSVESPVDLSGNRALSILLGRNVNVDNPRDALNLIMKGE